MLGTSPLRYRSVVADSARWQDFPFRAGDIVISAPSKCGTTWTQMICALLVFQTPQLERPLDRISPWLDMLTRERDAVVADLEAQRHRRFIKTHTPLDGLSFDDRVTYLCIGRDPRDVGLSFVHHMANLDFSAFLAARQATMGGDDPSEALPDSPPLTRGSELERFWQWVEDPSPPTSNGGNLRGTLHHFASFLAATRRPNVVLLHYSELEADLDTAMRLLAEKLDIDVPEARWPELVEAATFDRMRQRADEIAPGASENLWQSNRSFFHRGRSGQWATLLDGDDLRRYRRHVAELADPEVLAWAHRGTGGTGGEEW